MIFPQYLKYFPTATCRLLATFIPSTGQEYLAPTPRLVISSFSSFPDYKFVWFEENCNFFFKSGIPCKIPYGSGYISGFLSQDDTKIGHIIIKDQVLPEIGFTLFFL